MNGCSFSDYFTQVFITRHVVLIIFQPIHDVAESDGMIHQDNPYIHECEEDVEYQLSSSYAQCHWTIPDSLAPFITHVMWTLEEQLFDGRGIFKIRSNIVKN